GGQLTEAVRRKPYSVVLFDEIEKAHPDVFNIMLQLLDDGRLTDGQGRVVDFKNTIIIMTSNLGSEYILQVDDPEKARPQVDALLRQTFKPEFLNRIDEIIMFNRLGEEHISKIVDIELEHIANRLKARKLGITVSDAAKKLFVKEGYQPQFGARPLKRTIQNMLQNQLAKHLLAGEFPEGSTIAVDAKDGNLTFAKK
ncbi:MAG: AAA family ATPase, partial [Spirochaetia bacterium]|nr:AAA family ATPase [Spirochaetia bacterium]